MNKVFITDFKHLYDEKDLLSSSRFWSDFIESRAKISQQYGEKLLHWSMGVRNKLDSFKEDVGVGSTHIRHFLDACICSTELEAYQILSSSHDLLVNDQPIQSLKKLASSKDFLSKHENLSHDLDCIIKQHKGCVKTLQDMKENGLKAVAASTRYEQRILDMKAELEKTPNVVNRSRKECEMRIRSLEAKLQTQTEREKSWKVHYESLGEEEQDLVKRLRKTSEMACQEACDLHGCQIDGLVSVLREFVLKINQAPSAKSDRVRPLLESLDNITVNMETIVNTTFEENTKSYIYPDVQAWHKKFGFLEKIPSPVLRASEKQVSQFPKKGLSVSMQLAQKAMASVEPTIPDRKPWVYKYGVTPRNGRDTNNNKISGNNLAKGSEDVRYMDDVYVRAIHPFKATHPEHLQLKPGMRIKQKFPSDIRGMSFGWWRTRVGGPKTYGYYPSSHVILDA